MIRFKSSSIAEWGSTNAFTDRKSHRSEIETLCRQHGARRLEIFGSLLRDDFDAANSDVDVVVEFAPHEIGSGMRQYFDFKTQLERVLERPVDVIELSAMGNTRPKRIIERTKVPVYAASA